VNGIRGEKSRSTLGFRRWAAGLFDQQMWCFGRDIIRPNGNLLLDLGMCRYRSADPNRGSSMYSATAVEGGMISLWGFGMLYGEPGFGSAFVRRYDFDPRLTSVESPSGVHNPAQFRDLFRPTSASELACVRHLLPSLVRWLAAYEHWVAENFGAEYRERSLMARNKPALVPGHEMAGAWERVAKKCARLRLAEPAPIGPWGRILGRLRSAAAQPAQARLRYPTPPRTAPE